MMVSKWKSGGRLVLVDGKVDVIATDALLSVTLDPTRGGKNGYTRDRAPVAAHKHPATARGVRAAESDNAVPIGTGTGSNTSTAPNSEGLSPPPAAAPVPRVIDPTSYEAVRTRREEFNARKAEQEYRERAGELVEIAEYRRGLEAVLQPAIDTLQGLSGRLAARLAALTDVRQIQDLIEDEVMSVCTEIANGATALINPKPARAPQ